MRNVCVCVCITDLFRAAAEAGPYDILKLYNTKGNIINISPQLAPNSPHSCYKLEVVAADCNSELLGILQFSTTVLIKLSVHINVINVTHDHLDHVELYLLGSDLVVALGFDLSSMEKR